MMENVPIRLGVVHTKVESSKPLLSIVQNKDTNALLSDTSRVCSTCTRNTARYTCPRCNVVYCSVSCYKAHSVNCTESFYQEHVQNEMKFNDAIAKNSSSNQREMQNILHRIKEFQSQDTLTNMDIIEDRMEELVLQSETGELCIDTLTPTEIKAFHRDVINGKLSKYIQPWVPWWDMEIDKYEQNTKHFRSNFKKLIEEINAKDNTLNDFEEKTIKSTEYPIAFFTEQDQASIPNDVKALVKGGANVSNTIQFHFVELLFAYVLVLRQFNGDWYIQEGDSLEEPIHKFLYLTDRTIVLEKNTMFKPFSSLEEAVHKCLTQSRLDKVPRDDANVAFWDVSKILQQKIFICDALSEIIYVLKQFVQLLRYHKKKIEKTKRKQLVFMMKKVEFYRSWCYRQDMQIFQLLVRNIANLVTDMSN